MHTEARKLLDKYLDGKCTPEEKLWIERSYNLNIHNEPLEMSDEEFTSMEVQIWKGLEGNYPPKKQFYRLWPRIAAAASVILILGAGLFYFPFRLYTSNDMSAAGNILPGKNSATLVLGSGRKIILSASGIGPLAKEAGVEITKTAGGQLLYKVAGTSKNLTETGSSARLTSMNSLSTAVGEQYQVFLPDGSHVWLNSGSTIKFPSSFTGLKERRIILTGEAYFEVSHNKVMPFRVVSSGQSLEVLGTHFNVNAYADEPVVKTTLLEGSVRINENTLLKPGQQALNTGENIQVTKANTEQAIAWKNGDFVFEGDDLKTIMRQLSRWYNVEVAYQGNVSEIGFVSTISRSKNLLEVLKVLQATQGVHFKVEGRRILVMP